MERQPSFRLGALERLQSFKLGGRTVSMEKQMSSKSMASMEKQMSFKKHRDSPGKRGDTELHLAARAGSTAHIQKMLAADGGEEQKQQQLRELVAKQNHDGETALYVAAEKGHLDAVKEILKASDEQSACIKATNGFDAFHIAAKQGHLEIVKELLRAFPRLAITTNSYNATALDSAATQGFVDIVDLLLENDAKLAKIARNNGKTALHSAARAGHVEVVASLLSNDPGIGRRTDKKGQTALHMAVKGQNVDMVVELLKPDISVVNLEDNKGNRPLHVATRKGNIDVVRLLLSVEGIEINAVNRAGETALAIAESSSNEELAGLLREYGGEMAKEKPASTAKQLKQTVSDIKHDVQSQLKQSQQTKLHFMKIKKRLRKLHIGGLNNAISSNTVVAVLIATVAFAAIFVIPGQFVPDDTEPGLTEGQAYIAGDPAFLVFLVTDSLALFIALAVVVVQTSLIVVEQKAKKMMVFVMNKLMWLACLFVSAAFVALTYVVVGKKDQWLAWSTMAIGAAIMLTTLGSMCYCIISHRMEKSMKKGTASLTHSLSISAGDGADSDNDDMLRKMYAL